MFAADLKPPRAFVVLAALAACLLVWMQSTAGPAQPRHPAGQPCAGCHLPGEAVTAESASLLVASQEKLCAGCHPKAVQVSHPSGVRPSGPVPAQYPLDWKGDMTCSTCHEVHGSTPGLMRGGLRGKQFCQACHAPAFFDRMRDQGVSMVGSGHLARGIKGDLQSLDIDAYTLQCMGCHATYGDPQAGGLSIDRAQILRHSSGAANHPIGRRYAESIPKGRYKPEAWVTRNLLLPDGRLSCVTCHKGYAKEHGKLRVGKQGSALCFECHDI